MAKRPVVEVSIYTLAFVALVVLAVFLNLAKSGWPTNATAYVPSSAGNAPAGAASNPDTYVPLAVLVVVAGLGYAFNDRVPEVRVKG